MLSVASEGISLWKTLWTVLVHKLALAGQHGTTTYWTLPRAGQALQGMWRWPRGDPCTSANLVFSGNTRPSQKFPSPKTGLLPVPFCWTAESSSWWLGMPWVILTSSCLFTGLDIWSEAKSSRRCHGNGVRPIPQSTAPDVLTLSQRFPTLGELPAEGTGWSGPSVTREPRFLGGSHGLHSKGDPRVSPRCWEDEVA